MDLRRIVAAAGREMIHRSRLPDPSIPDVALTPFVLERARALGDHPALVDGVTGRTISYLELDGLVRRAAAGFARRGLRKGDVVALLMPNVVEYPVAFHGAALAGGVVTPLNPLSTPEDIERHFRDAGVSHAVTVPALRDGVAAAAAAAGGVRGITVCGGGPEASLESWGDLLADAPWTGDAGIDPREDLCALPYSSGTTGLPKGVMLTHRNLVANVLQVSAMSDLSPADRLIAVLPFFHIYGITAILNQGLRSGATLVVLPRFDLEGFLRVMQDRSITFAHVVPPIVLALARHPAVGRCDLRRLRMIFCAAAPLGAALSRECADRLGCVVTQGYGMTEASPATHLGGADPARVKHGSIGSCVPGTECRVVDPETGADRPPGEVGELRVRGPQVMRGYLGRPDATAAILDAEGWLRTGDLGRADGNGDFFVVDRLKEVIKFKGWQIAPAELEAVLLEHPHVADAAVVGVADAEAGEVPKAFVVARPGADAAEILAFVAARVAPYKKLRGLEFVEAIPKSPSGKVLRRLFRGS